ncbi:hypothetical protein D3C72_1708290 [compost metagenome]
MGGGTGSGSSVATASANGSVTMTRVPWPGWLDSEIWPPIALARRWQIASPSPVPPAWGRVRSCTCSKGSNMRACAPAGIPMPVSETVSMTCCTLSVKRTALDTRLARI